jgi:hypothetical protein
MRAAVVVGCDGYAAPNAALGGAVRDALAFWTWVCDPAGGGVTEENGRRLLLTLSDLSVPVPKEISSVKADKRSVETALHEIVDDAGAERDRLYVYFAGHGFSVDDDFAVQGAIALSDFHRDATDNSIVVTDLLSELSFTGFKEQILIFDACRNIPFDGRLRAGRISRPFTRVAGRTEQFCALATTAFNTTSDGTGTATDSYSFTSCLMRALAGEGIAKVWNEDLGQYVVRWDQMFEFVTAEMRKSVDESQVPRQIGERDVGDPLLSAFPASHFPNVNIELRVRPDDVASSRLVLLDPPDEQSVDWTAPGPATIPVAPRDYVVVATAAGFVPERRRWELAAYVDSTLEITFLRPTRSGGGVPASRSIDGSHASPTGAQGLTIRAPDGALAVAISLGDGTRLEGIGRVEPELEHSTTLVARVTTPDGCDGPVLRRRVVPGHGDEIIVEVPTVELGMRRFAERLELEPDGSGLVDVGGDTPAWPAPSSLLAMAWVRPGFVASRLTPDLPSAESDAVVVITSHGEIVVHEPDDVLVADPELQPFGTSGARRVVVDTRQMLLPNIAGRAVILDLTGSTPFAVAAPAVTDVERARRIDLGHRYIANGRLRPGLELLTTSGGDDEIARSLVKLVTERLEGRDMSDDGGALAPFALAVRSIDPLLEHWASAPRTSITVVSAA